MQAPVAVQKLLIALIAFKKGDATVPAIVVEPCKKLSEIQAKNLLKGLRELAKTVTTTQEISHFCIYKKFPVDVRHNAKIHRLTLTRYFQKHPAEVLKL